MGYEVDLLRQLIIQVEPLLPRQPLPEATLNVARSPSLEQYKVAPP